MSKKQKLESLVLAAVRLTDCVNRGADVPEMNSALKGLTQAVQRWLAHDTRPFPKKGDK